MQRKRVVIAFDFYGEAFVYQNGGETVLVMAKVFLFALVPINVSVLPFTIYFFYP